jgi:signal transduction histidine kinase
MDASGKYFFLGELTILPAITAVILSNLDKLFATPAIFFILNTSVWISQVSILFGIYSLTQSKLAMKYMLAASSGLIYASFIEICRLENDSIQTLTLISSISDTIFAIWTYVACKSIQKNHLKDNRFFKWIQYIEIGLGLFALIRIASCFTNTPINVRNSTFSTTIFYVIFVTLNIFRYISYQSLRISWVDPRNTIYNPLNINLAQAIAEKDKLLQGLIASNRISGISALASSLAHQLSQPLTAIGLQTETLKRDLIKSNESQKTVTALEKMSVQLGKLSSLVINLRQLFNSREYAFNKVDLSKISAEIIEIIEPTLKTKGITLNKLFTAKPTILGDAIQIQQVLINLFNNAVDAIESANPQDREIKFSVLVNSKFAEIYIEDTGAGISPDVLPSIFELYKSTKENGLGVGLWLSKTIVDKHNGSITASNSFNGGAIFIVQLPLAEEFEA